MQSSCLFCSLIFVFPHEGLLATSDFWYRPRFSYLRVHHLDETIQFKTFNTCLEK